ncbi:MAG: hypothetical protein QG594_1811 [Bacteroidota bacterium]|nr:hypothetical protein [Bacteroidota bacterium]
MKNNNLSLHKILKATPEKVFRAFSDPTAYASWISPYGFLCTVQLMDFKIEGIYKMSFTNFTTGNGHSFGGKYLDIKPNKLIQCTDVFVDPNLPGEMITTIWFKKVLCGTELKITQEGIPAEIPTEICKLGWQDSLDKLMKLVEPEIQDS